MHMFAFNASEQAPEKLEKWLLNGGDPDITNRHGYTGLDLIEMNIETARKNMKLARISEELGTDAEVDQTAIDNLPYLEEMQVILLEAANAEAIRNLFI